MIKRLLNRLSLTRIILILLVTIPPQSIWAEDDNYGLKVAGTTVTSTNASDILGDGSGGTGSVSYNEGENTLTLNNARITTNGNIAIESSLSNLNVYLVGVNTITCQGNDDIAFKGTASSANITFSTSSSSYGSLQIQVNSENQLFSGITPSYPDELSLYNEGYTYTIEATKFNIKVANIDVTAANASNILGGQFQGIVSYDANSNTLTLDNAQIDLTGNGSGTVIEAAGIDYFKDTNFTVKLIGTNSIKTNECEPIRYNGINDNKPTLTFSKENGQSCSLELSSGSTISGFSEVILNEGLYLSCSMPIIYDQSKQTFVDHTGEHINSLTITSLESYPLWIGGTQLTIDSSINGVSFTQDSESNPATLYLDNFKFDNAQLDGIVWTKNKDLTIQFSGNNIINCRTYSELNRNNGYCIFSTSSSSTLTLTATNNEGTLTLTPPNGGSNNSRKPIGGFSSFSLSEGCGMYSTDNYAPLTEITKLQEGIGAVALKGQPMGLKIAGVYVTTENKNNVTGINIATAEGGSISFEPAVISQEAGGTNTPATLTLNKATINGQIESTIEDLHVRLIGSNTITPTSADDAPIVFSTEGMVLDVAYLSLESSEGDNGEINLKGAITKSGSNNSI